MELHAVPTVIVHVLFPSLLVLTRKCYGLTQIKIDEEDALKNDYSVLLQLLHVILNSKSFIEFLCSCRFYIYATNSTKKNYFIMVLSSFLRDIAFASSDLPATISANRFVHYCLKWIPALREGVSSSTFLQQYMYRIDAELREINSIRFFNWCSRSLLSSSSCSLLEILIKSHTTKKSIWTYHFPPWRKDDPHECSAYNRYPSCNFNDSFIVFETTSTSNTTIIPHSHDRKIASISPGSDCSDGVITAFTM